MKNKILLRIVALGATVAALSGDGRLATVAASRFLTHDLTDYFSAGRPSSVAYDGSNFLIAAQSTNGGVVAFLLATNGALPGAPLELSRTGGVARVAFDGSNYLLVWPDFADLPSDVLGQFIRPDGSAFGSKFLIESDAATAEMGGLAFDGTNYLAVWERHGSDTNAVGNVQGRFITPAGGLLGSRLQISDGATAQKHPNVAWNGENHLVLWTGQTAGTNEWQVQGRRLDRSGASLGSLLISEHPAQQPWPPALASDGTNWLAAWSRESGPYPVLNSNLWLPMLYGRLVARDGTMSGPEIEIRRGGLGQFKPVATFNGDNYLVGWMERQRSDQFGSPPTIGWYWRMFEQQLDRSGRLDMSVIADAAFHNVFTVDPPGLAVSQGGNRFLLVWELQWNHWIGKSFLVRQSPTIWLGNLAKLPGGGVQLDLTGPTNYSYVIEASSNLVSWSLDVPGYYGINLHPAPRRITLPASVAGEGNPRFFRAFDGRPVCRENLRLIQQAKAHWALDHNKANLAEPLSTDLYGPGRYLPTQPLCPSGGEYFPGDMIMKPGCSLGGVAGHTN